MSICVSTMPSSQTLTKGDYVLATKYDDGDPNDHWCVGFYDCMNHKDRYMVVNDKGESFRLNGFERVKKISQERGNWLLQNQDVILAGKKSIWAWARIKMTDLSVQPRRSTRNLFEFEKWSNPF